MKDDLREAVARALLIHRGLDPDWFFERHPGTTVVHDEADAAIAAARPVIGEECAAIVDGYGSFCADAAAAIRSATR